MKERLHVLLVEGDPTMEVAGLPASTKQRILEDRLLRDGHSVRVVGSWETALNDLRRGERFDAVVIGADPFGMTGPQLLGVMENEEKLKGVPIILCGSPSSQ